jgi:ubiquinone/menaquinone biosynthesis C-methylase UbiE
MKFLKKLGGPHDLAVSMVGLKLGDRLLQVGCGDGGILAALAAKVGLTGRAAAVDATADGVARGERGAAKGGVLVEVQQAPYRSLPFEDGAYDVVVLNDVLARVEPDERIPTLRETRRILRPGGRIVVIEPVPRGGLGALLSRSSQDPSYVASGGAEAALRAEGFVAVRTLVERAGLRFAEGVKPRAS